LELKHKGIKKRIANDEIKRRLDVEKSQQSIVGQLQRFFEDFDRLMSLVLDKLIDITQKELIKTKCCWKTKKNN
jgi:hypothetical protein